MSRFSKLPTIQQVYYSLHAQYIWPRSLRKMIKKASEELYYKHKFSSFSQHIPIVKVTYQDFEDPKCVGRWGQVSDYQFGGDSKGELIYNNYLKYMVLKGKISNINKDRLETTPFIGMIQRECVQATTGYFNCVRVKLMGDGLPVTVQMEVASTMDGLHKARAVILSEKSEDWITYEIPMMNFQMIGDQIRMQTDYYRDKKFSIKKFMQQTINQTEMDVTQFAIRLQSIENIERMVTIKSIELAYSVRGLTKNSNIYMKPYFYKVDQNQVNDQLNIDRNTGPYVYTRVKV